MGITESEHRDSALPIGARVYTSDGHHLGEVKHVTVTRFQVAVSLQPDYWLPNDVVTVVKEGEIWLGFPKDRLHDLKRDAPDVGEPEEDRNVETLL
jgi:hypothetical protein